MNGGRTLAQWATLKFSFRRKLHKISPAALKVVE
jgi:hypothetical protein